MDEAIAIPAIVFFSIAATIIVYVLSHARTRRLLIERGLMDERYSAVLAAEARLRTLSALRWGLVTAGFALGLILADALGFGLFSGPPGGGEGLVSLGVALGSVAYYFVARRETFPAGAPPAPASSVA